MFNLGIQELALIFIIALLFVGPKQLPELAKSLGKMFRDFKRASNEITDSLQREAKQFTDMRDEIHDDIKKDMDVQLLPEGESVQREQRLGSAIEMEKMEKEMKDQEDLETPDDDKA